LTRDDKLRKSAVHFAATTFSGAQSTYSILVFKFCNNAVWSEFIEFTKGPIRNLKFFHNYGKQTQSCLRITAFFAFIYVSRFK